MTTDTEVEFYVRRLFGDWVYSYAKARDEDPVWRIPSQGIIVKLAITQYYTTPGISLILGRHWLGIHKFKE